MFCCMWLFVFVIYTAALIVTQIETVTVHLVPTLAPQWSQKSAKLVSTSTTSTASAPTNELDSFAQIMLEQHNKRRELHHAQPLHWNDTVYQYAAAFAQQYDCSGTLKHSGGIYGENLALGYTPAGAINAWYKEGETYDYTSHNTYDHFTALVWNSTSSLGCALKHCNNVWNDYIVCSYYPAGNMVGRSAENVFPS